MQALAAHLKRRNQKILEQELSLPKIPEVVNNQFTKTSVMIKKSRPTIKYVSETTFSPEEEHIHEQLKMVLQKQKADIPQSSSSFLQIVKVKQIPREKSVLPRIKESDVSESKKQVPALKPIKTYSTPRKSKSVNTKMNLDTIFRDRSQFIESYFAQINYRLKR